MCFISSVFRTKERDKEVERVLLNNFASQMNMNSEGFSLLSKNQNNKGYIRKRGLDPKLFYKELEMAVKKEVLFTHFRLATSGGISIRNTHFWQLGDYYFGHNGIMGYNYNTMSYGYKQKYESKEVDSFVFFKKLYGMIRTETDVNLIADLLKGLKDEDLLHGRGFLIDKKNNLVYTFGDLHAYLINGNYLVMSSVGMDWTDYKMRKYGDLSFVRFKELFDVEKTKILEDESFVATLGDWKFKRIPSGDSLIGADYGQPKSFEGGSGKIELEEIDKEIEEEIKEKKDEIKAREMVIDYDNDDDFAKAFGYDLDRNLYDEPTYNDRNLPIESPEVIKEVNRLLEKNAG